MRAAWLKPRLLIRPSIQCSAYLKGEKIVEKPLKVINSTEGACGGCVSTGCGTCAPAPASNDTSFKLTRRELGKAALAASAGVLLSGLAEPRPAKATQQEVPPSEPALSKDLDVVQKEKGPIMTVLGEFYKVGPGPSSSHTMGPMRITYDFFQRVSKLPEDQLSRATALKVHLFGSLSQTGEGHRAQTTHLSRGGGARIT